MLVLGAISFILFRWVLIPIRTEGSSMLPTYRAGQAALRQSPGLWRDGAVAWRRGRDPDGRAARAFMSSASSGCPASEWASQAGQVRINGTTLAEPYVQHRRPWDFEEVTLGPREYFVMGDNRGMSAGEHDFGRAHADRILGKVVF